MESVINQAWQWVRERFLSGLAAIGLALSVVGLSLILLDAEPSVAAKRAQPAAPRPAAEHSTQSRHTESDPVALTNASELQPTADATPCHALQQQMDSVNARLRKPHKSLQGGRYRARLRELKEAYDAQNCERPGSGPAS